MQFGIFSVSDVTRNPVTGYTPSEAERIQAIVEIARRADEVGLDVFAIGEHHNPPFFSSSPTTLLAHIAALTERIVLSTAVTLITTNDPVKLAEDAAVEAADTILLTVPSQLGVDYNATMLETIAREIAPAVGWSPKWAPEPVG